MIAQCFLIAAKTVCSFLGSVGAILPASQCGMVAATEAVKVGQLGSGQLNIFVLKGTSDVCGGVGLKFAVQARRIRALRVAVSSATGGWCCT